MQDCPHTPYSTPEDLPVNLGEDSLNDEATNTIQGVEPNCVKLFASCPICIERGIDSPRRQWKHYCGGDIWICDNAHFQCDSCKKSFHLKHLCVSCPIHSHEECETYTVGLGGYVGRTTPAIAEIAAIAGQLVNEVGTPWLMRFMENLGKW